MIERNRTAKGPPRRRMAATWVVLSALLFNLAAGYILPSSAQAALTESSAQAALAENPVGPSSGAIVICTPNGLRVIHLGPDGEPLPDQPQHGANCIYCLPFNTGQAGTVGVQTIEPVPLLLAVRITYPAFSLASSSGGPLETHPIRAPPAFR
ncbi:MAG: hypothetical protein HQ501_05895 [Rhodospirillales bacterium]|nr:hypothetical protein [Rhodospirillales bacterium]